LSDDERSVRRPASPAAGTARLLPSGDTYFLLHGANRELLVPDAERRGRLWTPRVWPGAVVVGGEVLGTWRRAGAVVTVAAWKRPSATVREAVELEARSFPLAALRGRIRVNWE
jgi:hypothetical protein